MAEDLAGYINISPSNAFIFTNACNNDMLIYTDTPTQTIHIGNQRDNTSIIQVTDTAANITRNIGIGKSNPQYPIDVHGDLNLTGSLIRNGVIYASSPWISTCNNVYLMNSKLAIGTSNATDAVITVAGDIEFRSNINITQDMIFKGVQLKKKANLGISDNTTNTSIKMAGYQNSNNNIIITASNSIKLKIKSNEICNITSNGIQINGDLNIENTITKSGTSPIINIYNGQITSSIVPVSNALYDLGSSNFRFRDLYLSSNTINLGGTRISTTADGSLQFLDSNNNYKKLIVNEIQIGSNDSALILRQATSNNSLEVTNTSNTTSSSQTSAYLLLGTETTPVNGGTLTIDTLTSLNAIVELSSNAGALNILLTPSPSFCNTTIGSAGNIVIVERNTVGRSITIDSKLHFSTRGNEVNYGFLSNTFMSTTISNFTTTPAPVLGGFAVDTISYYIPKPTFALGNYFRQFKCAPPTFNTIPAQTGLYTNTTALTLNIASYLQMTNCNFYGPFNYTISGSPSIPSTMAISSNGLITINQNTGYTGIATVTTLSTAPTNLSISFGVLPWYTPVITNTIVVPSNIDVTNASYITTTPILSQNSNFTGVITWSVTPSNLSTYLNTSNGVLTFPKNTALTSTLITLQASGPTGQSTTTSFTMSTLPWITPTFTTDYTTLSSNTAISSYTISAPTVSQTLAQTGTLTWSVTPSNLLWQYLNTSTGVLTFPIHTEIPITTATITATNPNGQSASDTFNFNLLPWVAPVISPIANVIGYTAVSPIIITPIQTVTNTGTLTWSMTTSPLNLELAMYLNTSTGVITIPQNSKAIATTTIVLSVSGPTGLTSSRTFTLTTTLWNTPIITPIPETAGNISEMEFTLIPEQIALNTGAITWSYTTTGVFTSTWFDPSTGIITIPYRVIVPTQTITLRATGPTGLFGTTRFVFSTTTIKTYPLTNIASAPNWIWSASNYKTASYTISNAAYGNGTYIVTSSSVLGIGLDSYRPQSPFDRNKSGTNWVSETGAPQFLTLKIPSGIIVKSYTMTNRKDAYMNRPTKWNFQGSMNGTNWTTIATHTGNFTVSNQTLTFITSSNIISYPYYKFAFSTNDASGKIGVGAIVLST